MTFFAPQNPGLGGLDELTNSEELFVMNLAGQDYQQGDILYHNGTSLTVLHPGTSGKFLRTNGTGANPTWETVSGSSQWDKPSGDASFTFDVDGNIETKTVGSTTLTFTYDINGNVDTISDGTNTKTFSYNLDGDVETIIYS